RRYLQTRRQQPVPLRRVRQRHGPPRPGRRRHPPARGAHRRVHRHGQRVPRGALPLRGVRHPHGPGRRSAQHQVCRRGGGARGACVCRADRQGPGHGGAAGASRRGGRCGREEGFRGAQRGV
ncbi:hypothetical protein E4U42_003924, partial [Claviceps africana]